MQFASGLYILVQFVLLGAFSILPLLQFVTFQMTLLKIFQWHEHNLLPANVHFCAHRCGIPPPGPGRSTGELQSEVSRAGVVALPADPTYLLAAIYSAQPTLLCKHRPDLAIVVNQRWQWPHTTDEAATAGLIQAPSNSANSHPLPPNRTIQILVKIPRI